MRCARKWRTQVGLGAMERPGVWVCTKMTISCEENVFDTPNSMKMGNNSVRFRFEWDIIGTVKSTIGSTSSFLHNLSSFLYRVGHREGVGHPRREVARAAVRERKESGWEGLDALPSRLAGSSPSEAATRVLSRPYFACGGTLGAPAGAPGASGAPPAVGAPAAGASKGSPHCGHFSALTSSHT